jgi:hypothetical protein
MYLREFENIEEFQQRLADANREYNLERNLDLNVYFIHELFHYLQGMSTTYFLSLNELLWSKTWAVYGFLVAQKHFGRLGQLNKPIGTSVAAKSYFGDPYTAVATGTIRGLQKFRDLLNGDMVGITKESYSDAIVSTFICWQKDPVVKEFLFKEGYHFKFDQWLSYELPRYEKTAEAEFVTGSISLFGRRIKTVDLVEHAAVICSLWPALMNERVVSRGLSLIKKYYTVDYYFMIERFADMFPTLSADRFYSNFLGACDFALNPPAPCEILVRLDERIQMSELLPYVRAVRAFQLLHETRFNIAPEELQYVAHRLGWVNQTIIAGLGALLKINRRSNWIHQEHKKAQQLKRKSPFLFADPQTALFDASLIKELSVPPVQFSGTTVKFVGEESRIVKVLHWFVLNVMHNFAWDREKIDWAEFCADLDFIAGCKEIASLYFETWYQGERISLLE